MEMIKKLVYKIPDYMLKTLIVFNMFSWLFIIGMHEILMVNSCITLLITTIYILVQLTVVLPLSNPLCYHPGNACKFICLPMIAAFIITIKNMTPGIYIMQSASTPWIKTSALILDRVKIIYLIILSYMIFKSIAAWFTQLYND